MTTQYRSKQHSIGNNIKYDTTAIISEDAHMEADYMDFSDTIRRVSMNQTVEELHYYNVALEHGQRYML